jgi:hypothetical protein
MTNRTLSTALIAIAVALPASGAFAAQFGRDTVYAAASATAPSTTRVQSARNEAQPHGRDTVHLSRIPGSGSTGTGSAELTLRPGRA